MRSMINYIALKGKVNKEGLRLSKLVQSNLDERMEVMIKEAIAKAKDQGAGILRPEHFEE